MSTKPGEVHLASRYEEFYPALRWYYGVPAPFDAARAAVSFPVWAPDAGDDEIELLLEQLRDEIATWRRRYEWLVGYRPIGLAVEAARFIRRSMQGLTQRTKSVRVRRNAARNR